MRKRVSLRDFSISKWNLFEDVRHERSLILLLSLTHPDILRQSKFTDDEINMIRNLAL